MQEVTDVEANARMGMLAPPTHGCATSKHDTSVNETEPRTESLDTDENDQDKQAPHDEPTKHLNNQPVSFHKELQHPNNEEYILEDDENTSQALQDVDRDARTCSYYFKKLDYEILRPLLIHNYTREVMHRQDDFVEMVINDGNVLHNIMDRVYGHVDFSIQESETQEVLLDRVAWAVAEVAKEINMQHTARASFEGAVPGRSQWRQPSRAGSKWSSYIQAQLGGENYGSAVLPSDQRGFGGTLLPRPLQSAAVSIARGSLGHENHDPFEPYPGPSLPLQS